MAVKENTVLFVDDELNILSAIRRAVMDESFHALYANSAKEALAIMAEQEIAVIVTDMRMPEMDGLQLLKIVKNDYPDTVRMVLSGYTQLSQVLATVNQADIFNFIAKPWDSDLNRIIYKAIEYYQLKKMKTEMSATLEQRNAVYKKMLSSMEAKMSDQESRLGAITKIGEQLKKAIDEERSPHTTKHLLKLLQLYTQESTTNVFDLSKEILSLADLLKTQTGNTDERVSVQQEYFGPAKGIRFLPVAVLESLLTTEKMPEIRHTQITAKKLEDNNVMLEITLFTTELSEQWQEWLAFWRSLIEKESSLEIKQLKHKENQVLQLQFSFCV